MYDQVTPRRRAPIGLLVGVLAGVLALGAIAGTVWVLNRDVSADASGPATSTPGTTEPSPTASPSEASPVSDPAGPEPSPTPTASAPPPPTVVPLRSAGSGRCLDVPGGAAVDGTALHIYDCNGTAAQQWTASPSGELRVLGTMCLDDPSGGQAGTAVTVWTCHGAANQQWSPQADGTVRNVATGLCLDVANALVDNGTPVIVYDCHAGPNQQWSTS